MPESAQTRPPPEPKPRGPSLTDRILQFLLTHEQASMLLVAAVVGLGAGYGAVLFCRMIDGVQSLVVGPGEHILENLSHTSGWLIVLALVAAGLLVSPLVNILAREAKGHGVPEIMEAVSLKGGRIRPRVSLIKALASALTIGTGGSVGREGPIAQIGAALGSTVGQVLRLSSQQMRLLVACGVASGIAATFNAPIAGVMFSVEVILGAFALHTFSPLVISSVVATIISRAHLGSNPAFTIPSHGLVSPWEVGTYMALGLGAGVLSVLYILAIYAGEDAFDRLPIPTLAKTPIGLGAVGVMILLVPRIFGNGYETIESCLGHEANMTVSFLLLLVVVKFVATSMTLGSGGSGGIFAPSLFIGAAAGAAFGQGVNWLFPNITAEPGAYALAGMAGLVAGACHAPITAILMLFELTVDYKLILPIMLVAITSSMVAKGLKRDSIYTEKLTRRGIRLHEGLEASIMSQTQVADLMHEHLHFLHPEESFRELLNHVLNAEDIQHYVADHSRHFLGILTAQDVLAAESSGDVTDLKVKDVMASRVPRVKPEDNLLETMSLFQRTGLRELPVVSEDGKLRGSISHRDIFSLYNREVLRQGTLGLRFVTRDQTERREDYVTVPEGYRVVLLHTSPIMVGKTLAEMEIRRRFNLNIVSIRTHGAETAPGQMPDPARRLTLQDMMVVVGQDEDLSRFIKAYKIRE